MTNSYVAEVVVYEDNGRVMAKVYPDYDVIDEQIKQQKRDDSEVQKIIIDLLEGVRTECNEELPEFSKLSKIIEHPEPFEPNVPARVRLPLQDVLHTFKRGHRVMVQVQSTWFPLVDRNPGKYVENMFEASEEDFIKPTQRVYRSSSMPSRLEVNVLPR